MLHKGCFPKEQIQEMNQRTEAYCQQMIYLEYYELNDDDLFYQLRILGNFKQQVYNHIYKNVK